MQKAKVPTQFLLPPRLKAKLRREAEFQNRSMNAQLTTILERHYEIREAIAKANPDKPDADVYKD